MAKPIRAPPVLRGEEAEKFLSEMLKKQNSRITKKEQELAKKVLKSPTLF